MIRCPSCSEENPDRFRLCGFCGALLASGSGREVRKTVTVLFSDVTGSTALGERIDPESLRTLMQRYFDEIKTIIERHGGTVEKFIGDAVMAVFGIPQLHEDDALRAVRAAVEIRDALDRMNVALESERGFRIVFRTGIYTGEVVTGDAGSGQTLATGDALNTAARLEQAAPPGEILIGHPTFVLVRDAVLVEALEPIAAKGKAEPVAVYRLLGMTGQEGRLRRGEAPLVGREHELARLRDAFRSAVDANTPQLVTVFGPAGVGKSRLVAEFLASISDEAALLKGRCLPYGEGITYWPVREIVHAAAGIIESDGPAEARAKLRAVLGQERDADQITTRVSSGIGLSSDPVPQEDIFWAVRRLVESLAEHRPLVLLFEDIHWAEPTLLDLIEYLAQVATTVPLLIICAARPELESLRPGWASATENATKVSLGGLSPNATEALLEALPSGTALPSTLRVRILERAEGNPLFVEEMLAMLVDQRLLEHHNEVWAASDSLAEFAVPSTIGLLLAARIDALPDDERIAAERASVAGRAFEAAAVRELTGEANSSAVPRALLSLVRKELLRPERAELTAGDAFQFRHILIRDAAYEALAKLERAELHERFADWLERAAGERMIEYEEIVAYHVEKAHQYRTELGETGARIERLGDRAGEAFARAGQRAAARSDKQTVEKLLSVAARFRPLDLDVLIPLGRAQGRLGRLDDAITTMERALASALAMERPDLELWARLEWLNARSHRDSAALGEVPELANRAIAIASETGNHALAARAWNHMAISYQAVSMWGKSSAAIAAGVEAARLAGRKDLETELVGNLPMVLVLGPDPARGAIARCRSLLADDILGMGVKADAMSALGCLLSMQDDAEGARQAFIEAEELHGQTGNVYMFADWQSISSEGLGLIGDLDAATRYARQSYDALVAMGEVDVSPSAAGVLANRLMDGGRPEEAAPFIDKAKPTDLSDIDALVRWKIAAARLALHRDQLAEAEVLAAEAERLIQTSGADVLNQHADAAFVLAQVLARRGRTAEAIDTASRALGRYEAKGNLVSAARTRRLIDAPGSSR